MYEYHYALNKAEDPEAYKKLANEGLIMMHPVSIKGQAHRPDNGVAYHSTVKLFDPAKDNTTSIHDKARSLKFTPPDPHSTEIEPHTIQDRYGNTIYALKLRGEHADQIKANHDQFNGMGFPEKYDFHAHISIDKGTWEHIVDSGAKTAHEAGIEFGHAQMRQGQKVIASYKHGTTQAPKEKKLAASEKMEGEPLNKGLKQMASAAAIAGIIGIGGTANKAIPQEVPPSVAQKNHYDSGKMLRTIAQVESSGGKFTNHRMMGGKEDGAQAFGKYGLMPNTIRETIHMNRDLKSKYGKAGNLDGADLKHFMQDNPGLEDEVAKKHLARLEHHFGQDPAKIGYAWLEGIKGTYHANKENKDIKNHWHVRKITDAYGRQ